MEHWPELFEQQYEHFREGGGGPFKATPQKSSSATKKRPDASVAFEDDIPTPSLEKKQRMKVRLVSA